MLHKSHTRFGGINPEMYCGMHIYGTSVPHDIGVHVSIYMWSGGKEMGNPMMVL
jgi:hypothetical protein